MQRLRFPTVLVTVILVAVAAVASIAAAVGSPGGGRPRNRMPTASPASTQLMLVTTTASSFEKSVCSPEQLIETVPGLASVMVDCSETLSE